MRKKLVTNFFPERVSIWEGSGSAEALAGGAPVGGSSPPTLQCLWVRLRARQAVPGGQPQRCLWVRLCVRLSPLAPGGAGSYPEKTAKRGVLGPSEREGVFVVGGVREGCSFFLLIRVC